MTKEIIIYAIHLHWTSHKNKLDFSVVKWFGTETAQKFKVRPILLNGKASDDLLYGEYRLWNKDCTEKVRVDDMSASVRIFNEEAISEWKEILYEKFLEQKRKKIVDAQKEYDNATHAIENYLKEK